jgi:hypothetical protein
MSKTKRRKHQEKGHRKGAGSGSEQKVTDSKHFYPTHARLGREVNPVVLLVITHMEPFHDRRNGATR